MLIASRNAVVDSRGLYASTITRKYVVSPGSVETAEKYVFERQFDDTIYKQVNYLPWNVFQNMVSSWVWDNYLKNYFIN